MTDKDPNRRIQAERVRELCGGVSDMWIYRRMNEPESDFPRPVIIGRRRFWREVDIVTWLDKQASPA